MLLFFIVFRLLICAPTNSAVDLLLIKLVASGLFDKTIIKRLISFSYYMSSSYNQNYDEYCVFPEFENSNFGLQPQEKGTRIFLSVNKIGKHCLKYSISRIL